MRHAFVTATTVLTALLLLTHGTMAQDKDPRITDLVSRMRADIEATKTAETEMTLRLDVVGLPTPPQLQRMVIHTWRDHENMRVEMPHMNAVTVISDNELTMYQGAAGFAVHIPADAMVQIKAQQEQVLARVGLPNDPGEMIVALLEKGMATVAGEESVDGVDCWVIQLAPDSFEAMMGSGMPMGGMLGGMGGGGIVAKFSDISMLMGKDTAVPKRMDTSLTLTQPNGVVIKVGLQIAFTKVEYGVEIPAALFSFEIPEGVQVVEWTVDKPVDQVMQEIQEAAMGGAEEVEE